MSCRTRLIEMKPGSRRAGKVELYQDGETGTWRLFLFDEWDKSVNVDFSWKGLEKFSVELGKIVEKGNQL